MANATIYHGGSKPVAGARVWATEDRSYATEYAAAKRGKLYRRTVDLSRRNVLDLRRAELDSIRAAKIITRETGIEVYGDDETDTHQLVQRITDAQWRAAGVDAIIIVEETDLVRAETICLITSK